jgi:hypothetical protein
MVWEAPMKLAAALVFLALLSLTVWAAGAPPRSPQTPGISVTVYDENPAHIWNRLFSTLFIRQYKGRAYGADELDPLLYYLTQFLLSEPSHSDAVHILNEFLDHHAQDQVHDPAKKAMLEHDLWAVFDWSARNHDFPSERRELQIRLAEVLRRLALSKNEIASLPDNYEGAVKSGQFTPQYDPDNRDRAFLPPDLFQTDGTWVCISGGPDPVSRQHAADVSERSRFLEFIRLPKGRKATLDYLRDLWEYPDPWEMRGGRGEILERPRTILSRPLTNQGVPQFPAGTQLALVRQMNLFDHDGSLVSVPITESVEIRVFRDVPANDDPNSQYDPIAARTSQDVYEIKLDRSKLFAGEAGGLRAIARDEQDFRIPDVVDAVDSGRQTRVLNDCAYCHKGSGIHSVRSVESLLKPSEVQTGATDAYRHEATATLLWKQERPDWKLLNGYWKNFPAEEPRQ